jgi:hypothetical protein
LPSVFFQSGFLAQAPEEISGGFLPARNGDGGLEIGGFSPSLNLHPFDPQQKRVFLGPSARAYFRRAGLYPYFETSVRDFPPRQGLAKTPIHRRIEDRADDLPA